MHRIDWPKVHLYFTAPVAIVLPMIFCYFSGNEALQQLISPKIEGLYGNSHRELGLIENSQNVVLLGILITVGRALIRERQWIGRVALGLLLAVSTFVFLEELDYGLHYYEYFSGVDKEEAIKDRNWHNVGDRTTRTKQVVDAAMILFFFVAPIVFYGSSYPLVRLLTPDRYAWLALIAMFVVRSTAHGLQDAGFGEPGTMDSNLSEFREFVTYYLSLVYLLDVFGRRYKSTVEPDLASGEPRPA